MPLISIITPVYNRADCIRECIESVSRQKCDEAFEHILVDDGSTDDSFGIISSMAEGNPNIKAYRLERNSGTNAARNEAVRRASGKYILLLDSDDQLAENALQTIVNTIRKNPQIHHFLFAADDRMHYYESIGCYPNSTKLFAFRDFLEGKIEGDFAHVLLRQTMMKYPFEESVRIFEEIFFLSFYKEVESILFNNKIVLNRDRTRTDSVTRIQDCDNIASLQRHIKAITIKLGTFKDDYLETEAGREILKQNLLRLYKFATFTNNHRLVRQCKQDLAMLSVKEPSVYRLIDKLNMGRFSFFFAAMLIKAKHKIERL